MIFKLWTESMEFMMEKLQEDLWLMNGIIENNISQIKPHLIHHNKTKRSSFIKILDCKYAPPTSWDSYLPDDPRINQKFTPPPSVAKRVKTKTMCMYRIFRSQLETNLPILSKIGIRSSKNKCSISDRSFHTESKSPKP